ncbi:hypothetical protein [Micromonospora lutea]|uniref:Thymidylate kinase n=1 Tax=Micromonospora lutea TaxID=419825 RepID=A0ABQ4IY74_9ACTN|nr:hypothetical protein [Micromonospora lutea]GIJ22869.1 hypothetical protein Vlu01_34930 [Micromonospora lutea]
MEDFALRLAPGSVVVFEGLDRAGKSTQLAMLTRVVEPSSVDLIHMPSGTTPFTRGVYSLLEQDGPVSGFARQLAHLACHAENHRALVAATEARALVLDRWWWSTMAYGWYGGPVRQSGLPEADFRRLIQAVWAPITAAVVFVFLEPHEDDNNNSDAVASGYRALMRQHPGVAVAVPDLSVQQVHSFITDELVARGLAVRR